MELQKSLRAITVCEIGLAVRIVVPPCSPLFKLLLAKLGLQMRRDMLDANSANTEMLQRKCRLAPLVGVLAIRVIVAIC